MSPNRRLNAALGYVDLGMAADAWNELKQIKPRIAPVQMS
jgi:hypothetical protein